ncbi:MAG: oligosaccharide flippase family protein [Candidatus Limnocylindria bacterium]
MNRTDVTAAARGGGIVFGGKLFAWGARFVLAVLLARLLGAAEYGLYTVALSIAAVGSALAVFGLDSAMIRYLSIFAGRGDRERMRGSLQIGFAIPIGLSILAATVLVVMADAIATSVIGEPALAPLLRITALLVPAMVLNSLLAAMLQGLRQFGRSVLAEQFLQPTSRGVILVVFALTGMSAALALIAMLISTIVVGVLMYVYLRRAVPRVGGATRPTGEIVRFSLPVYFSNVVHTFGGNLQTLLLGALSSVASAGIFAIANQIQLVGSLFHAALVRAAMPLFAELHDSGERSRLEHLYQTTSKWTFSLNMPFFLVSIAFPEALMALFGPDFTDGAQALVILAWGAIVNAATGTSGAMLDMTGHSSIKLINSTVSVGLAIGLNLLLIPSYGIVGAAIAAVAAVTAVNVLRVVEVARLEAVGPYNRTYLKPLAAGGMALALGLVVGRLLLADTPLVVSAGVGIVVIAASYVFLLRALGISDEDRFILGRASDRIRRRRKPPDRTRTTPDPDVQGVAR